MSAHVNYIEDGGFLTFESGVIADKDRIKFVPPKAPPVYWWEALLFRAFAGVVERLNNYFQALYVRDL